MVCWKIFDISLVEMLQIPSQRHFSNYEQSAHRPLWLPSNQNISHKIELPQEDLVSSPSTAENMPSGFTNSPAPTGSEGVSHPATLTLRSHGPADEEISSSCRFWLCLCLSEGAFVNTGKSRVTRLHHKLLFMWQRVETKTIAWKPDEILRVTDEVEKSLWTRQNFV